MIQALVDDGLHTRVLSTTNVADFSGVSSDMHAAGHDFRSRDTSNLGMQVWRLTRVTALFVK